LLFFVVHTLISEPVVLLRDVEQIAAVLTAAALVAAP
jgi:hypothetical protein